MNDLFEKGHGGDDVKIDTVFVRVVDNFVKCIGSVIIRDRVELS